MPPGRCSGPTSSPSCSPDGTGTPATRSGSTTSTAARVGPIASPCRGPRWRGASTVGPRRHPERAHRADLRPRRRAGPPRRREAPVRGSRRRPYAAHRGVARRELRVPRCVDRRRSGRRGTHDSTSSWRTSRACHSGRAGSRSARPWCGTSRRRRAAGGPRRRRPRGRRPHRCWPGRPEAPLEADGLREGSGDSGGDVGEHAGVVGAAHHHELVAAVAGQLLGRADGVAEAARDRAQDVVTSVVAVGVVDALEDRRGRRTGPPPGSPLPARWGEIGR